MHLGPSEQALAPQPKLYQEFNHSLDDRGYKKEEHKRKTKPSQLTDGLLLDIPSETYTRKRKRNYTTDYLLILLDRYLVSISHIRTYIAIT